MVKSKEYKKIMLRSLLWPGWGHLYAGERKKGWLLFTLTLVGLVLLAWGAQLWLFPQGATVKEEEVSVSEEGIIVAEDSSVEETQEVSSAIPPLSPLALTLLLVGLGVPLWTALYGIKDSRRLSIKNGG
ncbi:MAG: hypothetical protein GXO71_06900 [Caldiserica bacterium]|nr:hypothetical protein [Caldisericota bacterium]